jgi:glyceraldehyde 3-phosphate dehydrogenase
MFWYYTFMIVGINGLGRIGRAYLRQFYKSVSYINDPSSIEQLQYLLQYDTVHGKFHEPVKIKNKKLFIGKHEIRVTHECDPKKIPWSCDIMIESSGRFIDHPEIHLEKAKRVLVSAPAKCPTFVYGVNHSKLKKSDYVINNASCTTNCVAPFLNELDKLSNVTAVDFSTVHAVTSTQSLLDLHKGRRGRSAQNIIPSTTGAAIAVEKVLPHLKNKVHGRAYRVPVLNGSVVHAVCTVKNKVSKEEVQKHFLKSKNPVLSYSKDLLVSSDIIGTTASCIIDGDLIDVKGKKVYITAWYDNEWAYAARLNDMVKLMKK